LGEPQLTVHFAQDRHPPAQIDFVIFDEIHPLHLDQILAQLRDAYCQIKLPVALRAYCIGKALGVATHGTALYILQEIPCSGSRLQLGFQSGFGQGDIRHLHTDVAQRHARAAGLSTQQLQLFTAHQEFSANLLDGRPILGKLYRATLHVCAELKLTGRVFIEGEVIQTTQDTQMEIIAATRQQAIMQPIIHLAIHRNQRRVARGLMYIGARQIDGQVQHARRALQGAITPVRRAFQIGIRYRQVINIDD